jgi:hypothetical protein
VKKLIYIFALGLLFTACKKEPLPDLPVENGPYYSIKGYIDGTFINLNVGQEGILISQGTSVNNGVKSYYGQIVSPSEDLLIKIEFTRPEAPLTSQGLKALESGGVSFLVQQPGCLSPNFGSNLLQSNFLLVKDELGNFVPATNIDFDEFGFHDVTMKFTDVGPNSFQIPVQFGYDPNLLNPKYITQAVADSVKFSALNTSGTHEWYVDNNFVSNSPIFTEKLGLGIHRIDHKITDESLNEASHTTLLRITNFVLDWMMNMNPCSGTLGSTNYGKVTVTVLTGNKEYKSDAALENLANNFSINNIEYIGNSSMVPTRAVFDLAFSAILKDDTGTESLSLSGMSGTFNVGLQ